MRQYLVFGSDDKLNWALINTVTAGGAQQALNKARTTETHRHYAAVPERNWTSATPDVVQRDPLVKWSPILAGQMTVEEALDDGHPSVEELVEKAKDALKGSDE
jgi:hypothetical protein